MTMLRVGMMSAALLLLPGCSPKPAAEQEQSAPDLRDARTSLLAADRAFASASLAAGPVDGLVRALAPDVAFIASRQPLLRTPEAVRGVLAADTMLARASLTWEPVRADVSADGLDGYTYGFVEMTLPGEVRRPGKYLAYWRRPAGGEWKMLAYKRLPREDGPHAAPPPGFETPGTPSAPSFPAAAPSPVAQLLATDSAFAALAQKGAEAAFLVYTAADGATLSGGPEIAYGRERVAKEFAPFAPGAINWYPDHAIVAATNDLAFATGNVEIAETDAAGTRQARIVGRYLTIWKRQPDGEWRLIIDG